MAKYVNKNLRELIVFCILGGITTTLSILLLAFFTEIVNINYMISNVISYIIAVIISYYLNAIITFKKKINNHKKEVKNLFLYCVMKAILLGVDTFCLYLLVNFLSINLYVSKIILTLCLTIVSFGISKKIVQDKVW